MHRWSQLEVKDSVGNSFSLREDVKNIIDILGEPLKKENLWAIYPEAGCGFYKIDYESVSFLYYDNENKIAAIAIEGDDDHFSTTRSRVFWPSSSETAL